MRRRIVDAGIAPVVAAMRGSESAVAGRGFAYLRERGVEVEVGVEEAEAQRLNAAVPHRMRARRPFVIAEGGDQPRRRDRRRAGRATSCQRRRAQRYVIASARRSTRSRSASGTVLADDPLLTARDVYRERPLTRVVFDRRLRTPPAARVFVDARRGPVIMVATRRRGRSRPRRARALGGAGAQVVRAATGSAPRCRSSGGDGVTSLLVEGGPALHAAVWDGRRRRSRAAVTWRRSRSATGGATGSDGRRCAGGARPASAREPLGDDVLIEADVHRTH